MAQETQETVSFQAAYRKLQNALTKLHQAEEDDLDVMIECVEEAINARSICQERLRGIREIMDEKLKQAV